MSKVEKIYGLIPARAGSKGLQGKNTRLIDNKPLIAYTIRAAIDSGIFSEVYVSSDSSDTLKIASNYGALPLLRPAEISEDETSMDPVIKHFISSLPTKTQNDFVMLLQPTSPLRSAMHITESLSTIQNSKDCAGVISVCLSRKSPFKTLSRGPDGWLSGHFGENAPFQRRQEFPMTFDPNGAIYLFSAKDFLKNNCIPRKNILPYIMDEISSIDIDTQLDLDLASIILKSERYSKK